MEHRTRLVHIAIEGPEQQGAHSAPVIPVHLLYRLLGIGAGDLDQPTVSVNAKALRRILQEVARAQPFDPDFYAQTYPDLEAARLAGKLRNLHDHFLTTGFWEGRLPAEPPFDAAWYARHYDDLRSVFGTEDTASLRNHFLTAGLAEARAGCPDSLNAAESWRV